MSTQNLPANVKPALLCILFSYLIGICQSANGQPTYIGDSECKDCHESIYEKYIKSGHPYKV